MEKVLEVSQVTKLYGNKRGISDISFDVYRGDIFGFLGPNGAGKTTLMKVITGLCRANVGSIRIFGYDIKEQFEEAMSKVGCIIETVDTYEYLSAYKNLEIAARYYGGIDYSRMEEVLDLVGLSRFKDEKVSNYSLGMKQRLGLAMAILTKPELVILDEPTNGLDIEGMVEVRNIIRKLAAEQNITFFISSHLIHEMELVCSRVGIVYEGRLIKEGFVNELLKENGKSLEDYFMQQVGKDRAGFDNRRV